MNILLLRQAWREIRLIAFGYLVILAGTLTLAFLYWPHLRDAEILKLVEFLPFQPLQEFARGFEATGFWAWFCVQHLFRGAALFGGAAACLMGTGVIAGEVDRGTMGLLLSRPISRTRILLVRWGIAAVSLLIPLLLVTWMASRVAPMVDEQLDFPLALKASLYAWLFPLAALSMTCVLSSLFSRQMKAGIVVLGFLLVQLALYLVPEVWNHSLFNWMDLDVFVPFQQGIYPVQFMQWMAGVSLVSLILAAFCFRTRDF